MTARRPARIGMDEFLQMNLSDENMLFIVSVVEWTEHNH